MTDTISVRDMAHPSSDGFTPQFSHSLWVYPLSTGWLMFTHKAPHTYHSPVVSRVCLAKRLPPPQRGERVGAKEEELSVCLCACYRISLSKWFLRGGEGALRDGRDDLFCFPPFALLTTSWRCLVNFLH